MATAVIDKLKELGMMRKPAAACSPFGEKTDGTKIYFNKLLFYEEN